MFRLFLEFGPYLSEEIGEILTGEADLIVLAGFLSIFILHFVSIWLGRGHVCIEKWEKFSGGTIHYFISEVDPGEIILQKSYSISPGESPESLAEKIRSFEYRILIETFRKLSADFSDARS